VTKDSKAQAQYTPHAMRREQRCAVCRYYIKLNAVSGDCRKVEGLVRGAGWCRHFAK
jgi:hypothetical protein